MQKYVLTYNEITGFHFYPDAPVFCAYLRHEHRHVFIVRCEFEVSHCEREIEINQRQLDIENKLYTTFGKSAYFAARSCESIASWIVEQYPDCVSCTVLEDGYGGAKITR